MSFTLNIILHVLGLIVIMTCCDMKTVSFSFKRARNAEELTLPTDIDVSKINTDDTELPSTFMEKLSEDIDTLEHIDPSMELEVTEDGELGTTKSRRHTRYVTRKNGKSIHSILSVPTNTMRAYLKSKTGLFLRMNKDGELGGTHEINDSYVVFIIEKMSKGVVRLRGEKAGKYICINRKQKIITREKPIPKCLLRNYLEENHYELFWSYMYSKKGDGESGWFLALRQNGKIRKPSRTKLGESPTMFYVHRIKT